MNRIIKKGNAILDMIPYLLVSQLVCYKYTDKELINNQYENVVKRSVLFKNKY